jgi:homocysteine S-methyltransferase
VQLARDARDAHARVDPEAAAIRIAGAISPLADCFRPEESPGSAAGPEQRTIATQLVDAGADLLLIETMGRVDEARAAVIACQDLGRPVWLAVVARGDGRLLAGESFTELLAALADLELQALLINCSELSHLGAALPALHRRRRQLARRSLLGCYPHTGHNDPEHGWQTHAVDVERFPELPGDPFTLGSPRATRCPTA